MSRQQNSQQSDQSSNYDDYDDSNANTQTYGESEDEFLKDVIDVEKTLKRFEMTVLRGMYEDTDVAKGSKVWKKFNATITPIINEQGIREILGRLRGYVNKETILTFYDDEEIYKNMFYFDMSLSELIAKRADYWELDMEAAKAIKDSCVELTQSTLFRARKGFTAINMRTQYSKQDISRSDDSNKSKKTFLGIPLGSK